MRDNDYRGLHGLQPCAMARSGELSFFRSSVEHIASIMARQRTIMALPQLPRLRHSNTPISRCRSMSMHAGCIAIPR
ncbi:hypothetical protein IG631_04653 [Alternaria alternata]|nr:hypothetical protein IG631_04653 [Alternaria alternata]